MVGSNHRDAIHVGTKSVFELGLFVTELDLRVVLIEVVVQAHEDAAGLVVGGAGSTSGHDIAETIAGSLTATVGVEGGVTHHGFEVLGELVSQGDVITARIALEESRVRSSSGAGINGRDDILTHDRQIAGHVLEVRVEAFGHVESTIHSGGQAAGGRSRTRRGEGVVDTDGGAEGLPVEGDVGVVAVVVDSGAVVTLDGIYDRGTVSEGAGATFTDDGLVGVVEADVAGADTEATSVVLKYYPYSYTLV